MSFITNLFNPNKRKIKEAQKIVDKINSLASEVSKLSDEELKNSTNYFREKLNINISNISDIHNVSKEELDQEKEKLLEILPEVFARVREVSDRLVSHRHYDVQLLGGYFLAQNAITELFTGEGKTVEAHLAAYLYGLTGRGVHVVTVNDYLSKRDGEWAGHIFNALGMSVGTVTPDDSYVFVPDNIALQDDPDEVRKRLVKERDLKLISSMRGANLKKVSKNEAYNCDIVYGTNSEFGFDYLRDNMSSSISKESQRGHYFAIIDEADSILIDEARTPLIISAPAADSSELYKKFRSISSILKRDEDYTLDEKDKDVFLTDIGIKKVEKLLNIENLWQNFEYAHHLENALKAEVLFKNNTDYIVKDGEVLIVDEFTGRVLSGRRYSEGLHQAIEAKENVEIKQESRTLATISHQNYFRMYKYLAGMTGTAVTEAEEFSEIYNLEVVVIPTNKPVIRKDNPDVIYKTKDAKYQAIVDEIIQKNLEGRPVLVGTTSIDNSEIISNLLKKKVIKHNVLNAKQHEKEAMIVSGAGLKGAVTVATNMAGRGTDIKLGEGVKELGGLHIIGTERHESRRIDNQLRGRSGRQGDSGSSVFYVSLEDELMVRFGGELIKRAFDTVGVKEDMPIESKLISKTIEEAQKKVENVNFEIRKHLVEYDDVLNNHRNMIYSVRRKILSEIYNEKNNTPKRVSMDGILEYINVADLKNWKNDKFNYFIDEYSLIDNTNDEVLDIKNELFQEFTPTSIWLIQKIINRVRKIVNSNLADDNKLDDKEVTQLIKDIQAIIPAERFNQAIKSLENFFLSKTYEKNQIGCYIKDKKFNFDEIFNEIKNEKNEVIKEVLIIEILLVGYMNLYNEFYEAFYEVENFVILQTIDKLWTDHLDAMRVLREGISLRSYAQKNPLTEYKNEGFRLFQSLLNSINDDIVQIIYKVKKVERNLNETPKINPRPIKSNKVNNEIKDTSNKIGRNDPCPCGSGKKYKKCCYPKFG